MPKASKSYDTIMVEELDAAIGDHPAYGVKNLQGRMRCYILWRDYRNQYAAFPMDSTVWEADRLTDLRDAVQWANQQRNEGNDQANRNGDLWPPYTQEQEEPTMHDGAPDETEAEDDLTGLKIISPNGWMRLTLVEPNAMANGDPPPLYIRNVDIRAVTLHRPASDPLIWGREEPCTRVDTPQGTYLVREDPEDILGRIQQSSSPPVDSTTECSSPRNGLAGTLGLTMRELLTGKNTPSDEGDTLAWSGDNIEMCNPICALCTEEVWPLELAECPVCGGKMDFEDTNRYRHFVCESCRMELIVCDSVIDPAEVKHICSQKEARYVIVDDALSAGPGWGLCPTCGSTIRLPEPSDWYSRRFVCTSCHWEVIQVDPSGAKEEDEND